MTPTREEWRPIVGYEGLYEVSDLGRVRSLDRLNARGRMSRGRVLRSYVSDAGRIVVKLHRDRVGKTRRVSVLVLTAFVGPRPEGLFGCHNDGDPNNNRLCNLRWDTHSANVRDSIRHGTHKETRKTHCSRGHLLIDPNLSAAPKRLNKRICLACGRALCARRTARLRGKPFDMQREADQRYDAIMRAA